MKRVKHSLSPRNGNTVFCVAGNGRWGIWGTAQAGWGSHGLSVQEPVPLHHRFLSATCSFPKICHQKAPLRSPRGPEPVPALLNPLPGHRAEWEGTPGIGKPQSGMETDPCVLLGEQESPLLSPSEMPVHQLHPSPSPSPSSVLSRKT